MILQSEKIDYAKAQHKVSWFHVELRFQFILWPLPLLGHHLGHHTNLLGHHTKHHLGCCCLIQDPVEVSRPESHDLWFPNPLMLNLLTLAWRAVLEAPPSPWRAAWPSCQPCLPHRQQRRSSWQRWRQAGWGSLLSVEVSESRWCGQRYDHLLPSGAPDIRTVNSHQDLMRWTMHVATTNYNSIMLGWQSMSTWSRACPGKREQVWPSGPAPRAKAHSTRIMRIQYIIKWQLISSQYSQQ